MRRSIGDEASGLRILRSIIDRPGVRLVGDRIFAPDDLIAKWEIAPGELADIGLPPLCPFRLSLSSNLPITDPRGTIQLSWLSAKHLPVPAVEQDGTLITSGDTRYLLRDPLLTLVGAIEHMNAADDMNERLRRFAAVRSSLLETTQEVFAPDNLKNMVIYQATGLGIKTSVGADGYEFHPELLGDLPGAEEDEAPRRTALLNRSETNKFHERINSSESNGNFDPKASYVLTANTYVVLDPGVRAALRVVRKVSRSARATRQAFFDDKMSFLLPALREASSDGSVIEFSDRVIGVVPWERGSNLGGGDRDNEWFPDTEVTTFVVRDAHGKETLLSGDDIDEQVGAIREAIAAGRSTLEIDGETFHLDERMLDDLARIPVVERPNVKGEKKSATELSAKSYFYVKPKGNVDDLTFIEPLGTTRAADIAVALELKNQPKSYQAEGIEWLQRGYAVGMRGMLMADDMGLGKTFQILAFLRWLRKHFEGRRRRGGDPIFLVVAPKTLLGNWLDEVALHLPEEGLGKAALVFGENLKKYRKAKGRDILEGCEVLDREKFRGFDWVLTTYETLRDYQISFAAMGFEVIVFDEAQKIKESGAMVTEAARSQKAASLRIVMTGTPVENSVMDLWTLMDVIWPGRLGYSAKDFRKKFVGGDAEDLDALKRFLTEPQVENEIVVPQLMLRRMKSAVADLKGKRFEPRPVIMPDIQAKAYTLACEIQKSRPGGALVALQAIRNVSLHPDLEAKIDYRSPQSVSAFIDMSARFKALFEILDHVQSRKEKALVFLDLRRAQSVVADLIKHKFKLEFLPYVINGETSAEQRDTIRRGFQKRQGFEVLILAPRAAGFGLTLHSANHVVHLNRWWNPAVEDQCTDRAYRIGQDKEVVVWVPIARHPVYGDMSYDTILDARLAEKRARSDDVIVPVRFDAREMARLHSQIFGGDTLHDELAAMDWRRFEDWTIQEIIATGLTANKTPLTGDGGADSIIRLTADPTRGAFIQVKHRSKGKMGIVSENEVLDVLRAKDRYHVANPLFFLVTNGSVEQRGLQAAAANRIEIIDYSRVAKLGAIVRNKLGDRPSMH
jgi:HJR/Mrr/RecB family endonuclease